VDLKTNQLEQEVINKQFTKLEEKTDKLIEGYNKILEQSDRKQRKGAGLTGRKTLRITHRKAKEAINDLIQIQSIYEGQQPSYFPYSLVSKVSEHDENIIPLRNNV